MGFEDFLLRSGQNNIDTKMAAQSDAMPIEEARAWQTLMKKIQPMAFPNHRSQEAIDNTVNQNRMDRFAAPVKAQNKAAKNEYFGNAGDLAKKRIANELYMSTSDRYAPSYDNNYTDERMSLDEADALYKRSQNTDSIKAGRQDIANKRTNANTTQWLKKPSGGYAKAVSGGLAMPRTPLPAIAGFLGGAQGVSGASDLLSEILQTKDPIAAYRNWVGVGNSYE